MSRISTRFRSHLFSVTLALLSVVGIVGMSLPQQANAAANSTLPAPPAPPAGASATHVHVLLLHGLEGFNQANCEDSSGTFDRWGGFLQVNGDNFAGISWPRSLITTLGYFNGDHSCDDYLGTDTTDSNYATCQSYYPGNEQTNNEDIRHIACRFYWYVYENYTSQGLPVNILAHSMGGIIAKWALSEAAQHNTAQFPYPLLVYNVVTLSSPFQGVPDNVFGQLNQVSANLACNGCFDGEQLEVGSNSPYSIISQLNGFSSTEGYWTVIGSYGTLPTALAAVLSPIPVIGPIVVALFSVTCDEVDISSGLVVPSDSTVNPGPSLSSAAVVYYDQCIFHEEPAPGQFELPNGSIPLPGAASYQDDVSTFLDFSGYQGTVGNLGSYQFRTLPHPLAKAIEALGVTRGPDSYPPAPYPVYDVPGGGAFFTVWMQMSGPAGPLGEPTGNWFNVNGGQGQDFQGGSIYWSSATGTYEVQGSIHTLYINGFGGPGGGLGFPTANQLGIAGGYVSYFYGNLCSSRGPNNSGAAIYYTSTTGAHQVGGCIYNKYWNMNGPSSQLGFPTSDVTAISGGYVSYFYGVRCGGVATGPDNSGSAIYYNSSAGTHYVQGCVYAAYQRVGATGALGYPVSDENKLYSGSTLIGWASYFAGQKCGSGGPSGSGSAVYVPSSNNSASAGHEVQGCIYAKYQQMGGPNGMGFPATDEYSIYGGRESDFAGAGCGSTGSTIQWSSGTGAHEIHGCIYNHYVYLIRAGLSLGFPTTDEQNVYNSSGGVIGRENLFQSAGCSGTGSAILWSSSTGPHEVHGCIYHAYVNFGGPASGLGLPTSDEYTNSSGQRESDFQGGYIIWTNGQAYIFVNLPGCGPVGASC